MQQEATASRLKQAITAFRDKQLDIYRCDTSRLLRDKNSASSVQHDHAHRWVLELLQNAEDAKATKVVVKVGNGGIYVADNGEGLNEAAVEALSGTHLSHKPVGTIGRKGLGFIAVYNVARSPVVYSGSEDGIRFHEGEAKRLLEREGIDCERPPYEWLPFWCSRTRDAARDRELASLKSFHTVVKLEDVDQQKSDQVVTDLWKLPNTVLLTFKNLQSISVEEVDRKFEVSKNAKADLVHIRDGRTELATCWKIRTKVLSVPPDILDSIEDPDERARAREVSVTAALRWADGVPEPTDEATPLHVFYPTGHTCPLPMVLHAEFAVSSDRSKIIAPDASQLNDWLYSQLAEHAVWHINDAYVDSAPNKYVRLMKLFAHSDDVLRERLKAQLHAIIRLPNADGVRCVQLSDARFVSLTRHSTEVRKLLLGGHASSNLLHAGFDDDREAQTILKTLGAGAWTEDRVVDYLREPRGEEECDAAFMQCAWKWLAAWHGTSSPAADPGKKISTIRQMPLLPSDDGLIAADTAKGRRLAWRPAEGVSDIPTWLPVVFLQDWFRTFCEEADNEDVSQLLEKIGIDDPSPSVLLRAVGAAISDYWQDRQEDPGRFLDYLAQHFAKFENESADSVLKCPIPVVGGTSGWGPADKTYFGREWGNPALASLFSGANGVYWLSNAEASENFQNPENVYRWLGVSEWPRLVKQQCSCLEELDDKARAWFHDQLPSGCTPHGEFEVLRLEGVEADKLDKAGSIALLKCLRAGWDTHYEVAKGNRIQVNRGSAKPSEPMEAYWLWELKRFLRLPADDSCRRPSTTVQSWLPGSEAQRLRGLVNVVDTNCLDGDPESISHWLQGAFGVRTSVRQVEVREWIDWLELEARAVADGNGTFNSDDFRRWYEALLRESETFPHDNASCQLQQLTLVVDSAEGLVCVPGRENLYFDDDPSRGYGKAFKSELHLFEVPGWGRAAARKILGIRPLSQAVSQAADWVPDTQTDHRTLQKILDDVKPFVFTLLMDKHPQAENYYDRLHGLKVQLAAKIDCSVSLEETGKTVVVPQDFLSERDQLILHSVKAMHGGKVDHRLLALALSDWLDAREWDSLIEILMLTNVSERPARLESAGMLRKDIDRFVEEWFDGRYVCSDEVLASQLSVASDVEYIGENECLKRRQEQSAPSQIDDCDGREGQNQVKSRSLATGATSWTPVCQPSDASIGHKSTVAEPRKNHAGDILRCGSEREMGPSTPIERQSLSERTNLSPAELKRIGNWGEKWVALNRLPEDLLQLYPGATVAVKRDGAGVELLYDGKVIVDVTWINFAGEKGKPFDIEWKNGEGTHWVEVKSTVSCGPSEFLVSAKEWEWAKQNGEKYSLYRVSRVGTPDPEFKCIVDPHKMFRDGRLDAAVVQLKI